jgi:signal transduction histidine kinase
LVQLMYEISKHETDRARTLMLDKADKQVKKMTGMINGFLNVSRLESGKIHLNVIDFDLVQLIRDVIGELALTISSHVIIFENDKKIMLRGDKEKIESVIVNLLNNAIKYSPGEKNVIINCSVVNATVTVSVADKGIGIYPGDLEKLFERFYRGENGNSHTISGFGVGLYLSAEIIQRHSGRIWAESEFGQGSTFYFCLPVPVDSN